MDLDYGLWISKEGLGSLSTDMEHTTCLRAEWFFRPKTTSAQRRNCLRAEWFIQLKTTSAQRRNCLRAEWLIQLKTTSAQQRNPFNIHLGEENPSKVTWLT